MNGETTDYSDQREDTDIAPPTSLECRKADVAILSSITDVI